MSPIRRRYASAVNPASQRETAWPTLGRRLQHHLSAPGFPKHASGGQHLRRQQRRGTGPNRTCVESGRAYQAIPVLGGLIYITLPPLIPPRMCRAVQRRLQHGLVPGGGTSSSAPQWAD